jgi:hypothetical protein
MSSTEAGYGLFLAVGAIGDVLGGLFAHRAHRRFGPGRPIVLAGLTAAAGYMILAANSSPAIAVSAYALEAIAVELGNIATISLRH